MTNNKIHKIGIVMNGVTGRMGTNQHLLRSICAIIKQGGVKISDSEVIMPDPILVGRNEVKLQQLAARAAAAAGVGVHASACLPGGQPEGWTPTSPGGGTPAIRWTTDLGAVLADDSNVIYFDAQTTDRRVEAVTKAIKAGKHVYCEKPTATTTKQAYALYQLAKKAGVKHGVVQDKLWLPGLLKLQELVHRGFFGKILSVRGEFGYWVFEGDTIPLQRPSWNYRKEDGGGMIVDMLCHWRYVLDNVFGAVKSVSCLAATHIPKRWDENKKPYECTADDSAYSTFELEGGVIAHFNSSWTVRVRRDDLLTLQVDGTHGSAVAGLRDAAARLESRHPAADKLFRRLAKSSRSARIRQRVQGAVGNVPPPRRQKRTLPMGPARRRERRTARRPRTPIVLETSVGDGAGVEGVKK